MSTPVPRVHVCIGNPAEHFGELESGAAGGVKLDWWTVNKSATKGDRVVFYLTAPTSAFVATGVVNKKPRLVTERDSTEWFGHYAAEIIAVQLLPRTVSRVEAMKQFPEWGFLRQPRRSSPVPPQWAERFLAYVEPSGPSETPGERPAGVSDIEGTKTEVVALRSQRSRRLRNAAFQSAKGVCEVCGCDWSKVLGGRGVRVLQVHHRQQLSARRVPSLTRVEDLAVVCANCHLLLHLNAAEALSVDELRDMLQTDAIRDE
jgi:hypothetical protein